MTTEEEQPKLLGRLYQMHGKGYDGWTYELDTGNKWLLHRMGGTWCVGYMNPFNHRLGATPREACANFDAQRVAARLLAMEAD